MKATYQNIHSKVRCNALSESSFFHQVEPLEIVSIKDLPTIMR